mmetsp:Transcript_31972/g.99046  ORF Transcript_31972/g.99046 Transcript_31972/m.99046 type:complete len:271 (-) Transcript_31972:695-1507(-)
MGCASSTADAAGGADSEHDATRRRSLHSSGASASAEAAGRSTRGKRYFAPPARDDATDGSRAAPDARRASTRASGLRNDSDGVATAGKTAAKAARAKSEAAAPTRKPPLASSAPGGGGSLMGLCRHFAATAVTPSPACNAAAPPPERSRAVAPSSSGRHSNASTNTHKRPLPPGSSSPATDSASSLGRYLPTNHAIVGSFTTGTTASNHSHGASSCDSAVAVSPQQRASGSSSSDAGDRAATPGGGEGAGLTLAIPSLPPAPHQRRPARA